MTAQAERDLRLMAWRPDHPPSPGLLENVEGEFLDEILRAAGQDTYLQVIQATLNELTQMGLVQTDDNGGYRLTAAGEAALDQPPVEEDGPDGPVWQVTLYRPARDLPWVIDQITQTTEDGTRGISAELAGQARRVAAF